MAHHRARPLPRRSGSLRYATGVLLLLSIGCGSNGPNSGNNGSDNDTSDGNTLPPLPSDEECVGIDPMGLGIADASEFVRGGLSDTSGATDSSGDASSTGTDGDSSDGDTGDLPDPCGNCEGEPWPQWELQDVQPRSCGFGQTYGMDVFTGHVTVVALLAGW